MNKIKIILSLYFLISMSLNAQKTEQIGTSMANFLKIGVGPRAIGMGEAFIALANDASSLYWNPAGISNIEKNEIIFQSTEWIASTNLYFVGIAMPISDMGTFGASFYSFSSGEMEETTVRQPEGTGRTFSANNLAIGFSFARALTDRFSFGITAKYITESLSREKANAFAFDIGSIYITNFLNNMKIGFALTNLGSTMSLSGPDLIVDYDVAPDVPTNKTIDASMGTQSWDLPLAFKIGLGTYVFNNEQNSLSIEADLYDSRDYQARYNIGSEYIIKLIGNQKVSIRTGYKGNYDEESFTLGGGLLLNLANFDFKFDYAFVAVKRLGNVHRYSISILF